MGGGGHSTTVVKNEPKEYKLSPEELALIKTQTGALNSAVSLAKKSEGRSSESYNSWKKYFEPLELSMVGHVLNTNKNLGSVDPKLLSEFQAQALGNTYKSSRGASDKLKQFMAQRGLEGSGIESSAMAQLQGSISQAAASSLSQAFFQALQQSDKLREIRLQNLGQAVSIGSGFSSGGFNYQNLAGNQYGQGSNIASNAFSNWQSRWKKTGFQSSSSSTSNGLGNIFSFTKAL